MGLMNDFAHPGNQSSLWMFVCPLVPSPPPRVLRLCPSFGPALEPSVPGTGEGREQRGRDTQATNQDARHGESCEGQVHVGGAGHGCPGVAPQKRDPCAGGSTCPPSLISQNPRSLSLRSMATSWRETLHVPPRHAVSEITFFPGPVQMCLSLTDP